VGGLVLVLAQLLPPVQTEQIQITLIYMIRHKDRNKKVTQTVENTASKELNHEAQSQRFFVIQLAST